MSEIFFTYEDFKAHLAIPRETFERFQVYVDYLIRWQNTINLVSKTTLQDIWMRHIIDSAQLFTKAKDYAAVSDLGSGGGLPGMILGIMGIQNITLVESDVRKAAFLKEVARITETKINVVAKRVENFDLKNTDLISARAFASIKNLLSLCSATLTDKHTLLLLKGKTYKEEIKQAKADWDFDCETTQSITDNESAIVTLRNLKRVRTS